MITETITDEASDAFSKKEAGLNAFFSKKGMQQEDVKQILSCGRIGFCHDWHQPAAGRMSDWGLAKCRCIDAARDLGYWIKKPNNLLYFIGEVVDSKEIMDYAAGTGDQLFMGAVCS